MTGPSRSAEYAEESAEVEVLIAHAKKHEELGKKIQASLARIKDIGSSLEEAAGPVYNDTQQLQVTNNNIDKILAAIESMKTPLEGKADEERVIREGPSKVGIQAYLASLRRVESKYSQLSRTPMRVNQEAARELSQLLSFGAKQLQELFNTIIQDNPNKVEPLQFISKGKPFPRLAQDKVSQLGELDSFIASTQRDRYQAVSPTVQQFADVRGRYLYNSLSTLASASITTSRRQNAEEIYRQGTSAIGTYSIGIEQIFVAEWGNIISIFGQNDCGKAFELTTAKALAEFTKILGELNTQIKASITTDCFLAYEIIDIVNKLALEIDRQTGQLKQQIMDIVKPIRDTAKHSLSELLEDVRRRIGSMMFLPQDGAAIPFTTEVMTRLQALSSYPQPLASILTSLGDGNWVSNNTSGSNSSLPTLKSFDVSPDASALIGHYVVDTLEALFSNLESKARSLLKTRSTLGVFIANNVAVVDRMIRSSDLGQLLSKTTAFGKVEAWRKKGFAAYLDSWKEPCATLMDVQYTNRGARPPSGSAQTESAAIVKGLSSKDKDAIKEKFKTFNVLFESLSSRHREMAPSMEREVRMQLVRDIQAMIEPLYNRFWERYHEVDKGKGKYVRYDKTGLTGQLASLA